MYKYIILALTNPVVLIWGVIFFCHKFLPRNWENSWYEPAVVGTIIFYSISNLLVFIIILVLLIENKTKTKTKTKTKIY